MLALWNEQACHYVTLWNAAPQADKTTASLVVDGIAHVLPTLLQTFQAFDGWEVRFWLRGQTGRKFDQHGESKIDLMQVS